MCVDIELLVAAFHISFSSSPFLLLSLSPSLLLSFLLLSSTPPRLLSVSPSCLFFFCPRRHIAFFPFPFLSVCFCHPTNCLTERPAEPDQVTTRPADQAVEQLDSDVPRDIPGDSGIPGCPIQIGSECMYSVLGQHNIITYKTIWLTGCMNDTGRHVIRHIF